MLMVVVVVVQEAERFLMVQEAKTHVAGTWNLPGGRVEQGEGLADAAVREVREEAGVDVALSGLMFVDQVLATLPGAESRMRFVFQAELRSRLLKSQPDEHSLGAAWCTRADIANLPLRSPTVLEMVDLASRSAALLPMPALRARPAENPVANALFTAASRTAAQRRESR